MGLGNGAWWSGMVRGQAGMVRGQVGMVRGQGGMVRGQVGMALGLAGMVRRQAVKTSPRMVVEMPEKTGLEGRATAAIATACKL